MYNIVRLIIIAIMITYFIGCILYFLSNELNFQENRIDPEGTFVNQFFNYWETKKQEIDCEKVNERLLVEMAEGAQVDPTPEEKKCFKEVNEKTPRFGYEQELADGTKFTGVSTQDLLVTSAYFAITTLSTVGYGDMYPISEMEKIVVVVIMLSGVAFFSYIMGNFIEIISNQEQKMGYVDKSPELDRWMIELQRFNDQAPLKVSLADEIFKSQNYFWGNNRLICFNELDKEFLSIPEGIKIQMVCNYLFRDIFDDFKSFFTEEIQNDKFFLYHFTKGLMPRKFDYTCSLDRIIYDEGQEVAEMYFV